MKLLNDNILVTEIVKDLKVGSIIMNQDDSTAYMFCKVVCISDEALDFICKEYTDKKSNIVYDELNIYDELNSGELILIIRRSAKDPFIGNQFFISYKDLRGIITKEELESIHE
jgi:hypothetical protein